MQKVYSVEEYIEEHGHFKDALNTLRDIINSTELEESIKWNAPVYSLNGKNVLSIGAFKNHCGIWFFNGVFLKDEQKLLANAQEGKTKTMRQMRFENTNDIDNKAVLSYVKEAIENQRLGKEIKPDRTKKETIIPKELQQVLEDNTKLKTSFNALSNYKQREYCDYIAFAKREATKQTRLDKVIPMILEGVGLNDKYKNC
ncbi:YdeI/OmpD-associated family protein [Hyunsoonleella aestuarii]|uniref:YdeI family protein n=1 Tax=Hyunsoonleella aestuarii TaxID=912802 RepID=A0ABP8E6T7_9FLAO|nr:DUF1801 domain-containing protein [Hyunsoonleella aestuarii]